MGKILLLDDDRFVIEQITSLLNEENHEIAFIPRGEFLFKRLEQEEFDLLLLDINLPGKDGFSLLQELRAEKAYQFLPIVMITAEEEAKTLSKCFEFGANDYIKKPINSEELKARVKSIINAYKYQLQELNQERKNALQAKMMMLSSQMNPHFIFNSLGSIQSYILANESKKAVDFISEFAALMRSNLENSSLNYISIAEELAFLQNYIQLEQVRFNHRFDYQIKEEVENIYDTLIPPMLLQPFVENAIIHGLSNLDNRKGQLTIHIKEEEEQIICTIIDNGVGRAFTLEKKKEKHKSTAISNLEARLELLNSVSGYEEYTFELEDLYENKAPTGTKVCITFPNDLH